MGPIEAPVDEFALDVLLILMAQPATQEAPAPDGAVRGDGEVVVRARRHRHHAARERHQDGRHQVGGDGGRTECAVVAAAREEAPLAVNEEALLPTRRHGTHLDAVHHVEGEGAGDELLREGREREGVRRRGRHACVGVVGVVEAAFHGSRGYESVVDAGLALRAGRKAPTRRHGGGWRRRRGRRARRKACPGTTVGGLSKIRQPRTPSINQARLALGLTPDRPPPP